jgi:hypothetical protein
VKKRTFFSLFLETIKKVKKIHFFTVSQLFAIYFYFLSVFFRIKKWFQKTKTFLAQHGLIIS